MEAAHEQKERRYIFSGQLLAGEQKTASQYPRGCFLLCWYLFYKYQLFRPGFDRLARQGAIDHEGHTIWRLDKR